MQSMVKNQGPHDELLEKKGTYASMWGCSFIPVSVTAFENDK